MARNQGHAYRILSFLFLLMANFFWSGPLFETALAASAPPREPIRVVYGFDRELPPFTFEEAGGVPTGFEVDLVRAIFENTDAELFFRPLQWDLVPLELSQGTINLTSGMVQTEQRSRLYLFSQRPTFQLQIRLFTKIYNRFPSASLLRGQPVAVQQGSYEHRLLDEFGGINIKLFKGRADGLRALYNDEVAAYCGPVQNAYYYINKLKYGAITTVGTPLGITEMRLAVNRERGDILKLVDDGFSRIVANGEYDRLYRKWFVRDLTDQEIGIMLQTARNAAIPAYVPYDGVPIQGASVLTATGKVYSACSVDNAASSLALTALHAAVAKAVSDGEYEIRAALIVDPEGRVVPPTADELQILYEFGRGIMAVLPLQDGIYGQEMVAQLLAHPVVRPSPLIRLE